MARIRGMPPLPVARGCCACQGPDTRCAVAGVALLLAAAVVIWVTRKARVSIYMCHTFMHLAALTNQRPQSARSHVSAKRSTVLQHRHVNTQLAAAFAAASNIARSSAAEGARPAPAPASSAVHGPRQRSAILQAVNNGERRVIFLGACGSRVRDAGDASSLTAPTRRPPDMGCCPPGGAAGVAALPRAACPAPPPRPLPPGGPLPGCTPAAPPPAAAPAPP